MADLVSDSIQTLANVKCQINLDTFPTNLIPFFQIY